MYKQMFWVFTCRDIYVARYVNDELPTSD